MQIERITFFSDGLELSGAFFTPDDYDSSAAHPLVVPCSGFTGLMKIHPTRFAQYFTRRGYLCFAFDYRGFAESEGQRGRVILDEQVRDITYAVSFAEEDPRVDRNKIILLGWGMGAGLIIDASRELMGVLGLICVNGFYSGKRLQMAHRDPAAYLEFRDQVRGQYARLARGASADRADPFLFYPLDLSSRTYVDNILRRYEHYDTDQYSAELADSLLRWYPEAYAPHMRTPILIAHSTRNALHPYSEAESLFSVYGGPKELYWLYDVGHTEWMHDDNMKFQELSRKICDWMENLLASL